MSLTLIEAIAGRAKRKPSEAEIATKRRVPVHAPFRGDSDRQRLAFWNHERLGIEAVAGIDEVSLALVADAWSWT
jgi:hypothetical protein